MMRLQSLVDLSILKEEMLSRLPEAGLISKVALRTPNRR